jgi:hypothetical protein
MDCTSIPFTRQVNRSFGSESSQVPFYEIFVFSVANCKCRFWVQTCTIPACGPHRSLAVVPPLVERRYYGEAPARFRWGLGVSAGGRGCCPTHVRGQVQGATACAAVPWIKGGLGRNAQVIAQEETAWHPVRQAERADQAGDAQQIDPNGQGQEGQGEPEKSAGATEGGPELPDEEPPLEPEWEGAGTTIQTVGEGPLKARKSHLF